MVEIEEGGNSSVTPATAPLVEFHEALWEQTINNALKTAFYQNIWQEIDIASVVAGGPSRLSQLPLVNKRSLQTAGSSAQNAAGEACIETISSGTTGKPFVTKRGRRELDFLRKFYGRVLRSACAGSLQQRGIAFNRLYHGNGVAIPSNTHWHRISIYDSRALDYVFDTLCTQHQDYGVEDWCTIMVGPERVIAAAIHEAANRFEQVPCRIQLIVTGGSYVSRDLRARAQRLFNAPIVDRYSMSEVFGGATEDIATGWYKFDPCLIVEVVNPITRKPVENGFGLLVLTALYPFQIVQPIVRYDTGDIVEVLTESCGKKLVKPRGRMRHGVIDPLTGECLIVPTELYEIIEKFPEITRRPLFLDAGSVKDNFAIGLPNYAITAESDGDCLDVRLLVQASHSDRSFGLTKLLQENIVSAFPHLAQAVHQRRAIFNVEAVSEVRNAAHMWA